ncbi:MAG: FG-GAP-like repeat-containing protein [Planctomycetota bacterium]
MAFRNRTFRALLLVASLVGGGPASLQAEGTLGSSFRRGDTNGDLRVDISDGIATLAYLFLDGTPLSCLDAADSDDSGAVNISDPIYLLNFLFLGGVAPAEPFAECGPDLQQDSVDCQSFPGCPDLLTADAVGRAMLPHGVPAAGARIADPFGRFFHAEEDGTFRFPLEAPGEGWSGALSLQLDEYVASVPVPHLTDGALVELGIVILELPAHLQRVVVRGAVRFPGGDDESSARVRIGTQFLAPLDGSGQFERELVLPRDTTFDVLAQSERDQRILRARTSFVVDGTVDVELGVLVLEDRGPVPFGGPCCRTLSSGTALNDAILADVDSDGALDLVGADIWGAAVVVYGDGKGEFGRQESFPIGDGRPWAIVPGDWNGDGAIDLALPLRDSSEIAILLGARDGTFEVASKFPAGGGPQAIASGDFDEDGALDLVVANEWTRSVSVLLGAGDGTFGPEIQYETGSASRSLVVSDLNVDGHLDLAVANGVSSDVSILLGSGDGAFRSETSYSTRPISPVPRSIGSADMNGDDVPDLIVLSEHGDPLTILQGVGDGTFDRVSSHKLGEERAGRSRLSIDDLNRDGVPDVVVAKDCDGVWIALGRGDGTLRTPMHFDPVISSFAVSGDLNRDGHPDLVTGGGDLLDTLSGTGDGNFLEEFPRYAAGDRALSMVSGDLDLDGHVDIALANFNSQDVSILHGNGEGSFATPARTISLRHSPRSIAIGDLHGEGRLDIVVDHTLIRNLGEGRYRRSDYRREPGSSIALGDLNGDGLADLALTGDRRVEVRLRQSSGEDFEEALHYEAGGFPTLVIFADLNGDDRLDMAVAGEWDRSLYVLLSTGGAAFESAVAYPLADRPRALSPGDLNGDGALDLLVGTRIGSSLLFGRGDGTLRAPIEYSFLGATTIADVDQDGALDAIVTSRRVQILLGLEGGLLAQPILFPTPCVAAATTVADFDEDGAPDVAVLDGNHQGAVSVLRSSRGSK